MMQALANHQPMSDWLEQAWLQRYLDRGLSEEETAWFEAYVLDRPALLDVIELDTDLRDAAARVAWSGDSLRQPRSRQVCATDVPARGAASGWRRSRRLASAAALILGIGLGGLLTMMLGPDWVDSHRVLQPPRIIHDALRGAGYHARHEAGDPESDQVLVEVAVPRGLAPVSAAVLRQDGRRIGLPAPRVTSEGFLGYLLPVAWLEQSQLRIDFDPQSTPDPVLVIELVKPE